MLTGFLRQVAAQEIPEYQLKAAFLYNFAKFTEWPENTFKDGSAPVVVVIFGEDPFGENINFIKDKSVKNRKLEIKRCHEIKELAACHILFVSSSEKKRLSEILAAIKISSVLTVSDIDSFIESGGVIRFVLTNDNLGFAINAEAVKRADFKISSQLLKFGQLVHAPSNATDN
jgi:hypothetical protein